MPRTHPRPSPPDLALAAGLLAVGLGEAVAVRGGVEPSLLVVPLLTVPLLWRASHPSAVALAVTAALVVQQPVPALRLFDETFTGFVCAPLAWYALGRHGRRRSAGAVLVGCALAVAAMLGWYDRSLGTFGLGVVSVLAAAAVGRGVAARARLRGLLDRQADLLHEGAELEERARVAAVRGRIAGEVQALVRRRVEEMVDRAGAAARRACADRSGAAELAGRVEADGRAALAEMRAVLVALRRTGPETPTPDPVSLDVPSSRVPVCWVGLLVAAGVLAVGVVETAVSGGFPTSAVTLAVPLLCFAAGYRTGGIAASAGLGAGLAAVVPLASLAGDGSWGDYVFPWLLVALSWLGGRLVRTQNLLVESARSRAAELDRRAQARAAAAAVEERHRLARDLHDVLSHTLMVMIVQAGAARRCLETDREAAAVEVLGVVQETGRGAASELGRLLTLVDPGEGANPEPGSVPGDAGEGVPDLSGLVERARAAGLAAELVVEGHPAARVPSGLGLTVYRIVQEAITNVVRHARAEHVRVLLRHERSRLLVEVRDDGRGAEAGSRGGGLGTGITGMRERTRIFRGELSAGPGEDGGFVVSASFPFVSSAQEQPA